MTDDLNILDDRINARGFFERILQEREQMERERIARINDRFKAMEKALELQAVEYERRLHALNGEYQRDRERQNEYVTTDKWETRNEAEATARQTALQRIDEKFDDYIKRYELRQREVDVLLAAQQGAADEAKRAVEGSARKANRNLGLASLALGLIVFAANTIPLLLK